jgi:hypothetical protein
MKRIEKIYNSLRVLDCDMAKPEELYSDTLNASTKKAYFGITKFLGVLSVI